MSNTNESNISFNPSWMQSATTKSPRPNGVHVHRNSAEDDSGEMVEPVFAKYRYGREDILALLRKDNKPPDGLKDCPFFVEEPLDPIIFSELNEVEMRLQQNINSSKALSAAHRADWQTKEADSPTPQASNPWTVAGSHKSTFKTGNNRWTTVGSSSDRPKFQNKFGSPANGEKKPARAWTTDHTKRHHQASGSDEGGPNGMEAEWSASASAAWKDQKSDEKKPEQSRTFNRPANPWTSKTDSVWSNDIGQASESTAESFSKPQEPVSLEPEQPPFAPSPLQKDGWYYLDPTGVRRGPFETHEMHAWFLNGYFSQDLQIMKNSDGGYTQLSELIKINGALNPFLEKKRAQPSSPPTQSNPWSKPNTSELSLEQVKLKEKERQIADEERKLREREELLKREEQERLDRERKILERELEVQKRQEELERLALEKEKELELRRIQVMEYEKKRMEEYQKFEEEKRQRLIQEEQERRRQAELVFAVQEQERQRQFLEQEAKLKHEAEQKRQRDEALRIQKEQQQQLREQAAREQATRDQLARDQALAKAYQQQEQELLARQQQIARAQAAAAAAPSKAPWLSATKQRSEPKHDDVDKKTLLEIQLEEERQMLKLREEQEKIRQQAQTEAAAKKSSWAGQGGSPWSVPKNVVTPVPIPPAKEAPRPQPKAEKPKPVKKEPAPAKVEKKVVSSGDPLTDWVIQRVRTLNSSVEPELFASFLLSIDSPNEVEDYVLTYFGENKNAKEFHHEFLSKRIELRPRRRLTDKDDLSGPAAAAPNTVGNGTTTTGSSGFSSVKNKKNKKGKKVEGLVLGFRPGGDPNRFNVGEIDNTPPVPVRRR